MPFSCNICITAVSIKTVFKLHTDYSDFLTEESSSSTHQLWSKLSSIFKFENNLLKWMNEGVFLIKKKKVVNK